MNTTHILMTSAFRAMKMGVQRSARPPLYTVRVSCDSNEASCVIDELEMHGAVSDSGEKDVLCTASRLGTC